MPHISRHVKSSKVYNTPRRPFVLTRIRSELELAGKFGLKNKNEIYKAKFMLGKIRKTARVLLTMEAEDTRRKYEGEALLRRLHALGILDQDKNELDYILALKVEDVLKRRLQSVIADNHTCRTVHQARVYIQQKHIQVGQQVVQVPSFLVRTASEKHIRIAENSAFGNSGKLGRVKTKKAKAQQ